MNKQRIALVSTKAVIYMGIAAITPWIIAVERWIDTPPANEFEVKAVILGSIAAALTTLKSFMSDSSLTDKPKPQPPTQ